MQVVMRSNESASLDGVKVTRFLRGVRYTVPDVLGDAWVRDGKAVDADAPAAPVNTKPAAPTRRKQVAS